MAKVQALLVACAAVLAASSPAFAAETNGPRLVDSVKVDAAGLLGVYLNGVGPLCPDTTDSALLLDTTAPNTKLMVDLIYGAYLAKRRVGLVYTCGTDGKPRIQAVRLYM